jgi:hypothetical protein
MIHSLMYNNKQKRYKSGISNSTQWCPTINNIVQKQMKVLWTLNMQVLVLWNFIFLSFFLLFILNKRPLKVSREYMCQALKLKRKWNFEDCATQVNSSKSKYGLHDQHFTSCKSHILLLIVTPPHATKL